MWNTIKKLFNSQIYAISLYARQISGTIVLFLIARYLTVYDFGLFSSYKNIATFLFMLANLGFSEYILVSSKAKPVEVKLKITIFMLNAMLILFLICFGSIFTSLESKLLFCLVAIRTFFDGTFFALILPYFQATKKFNIIGTINIIYAVCVSLIAIFSFIFKLSLIKFLLLNIILGLINFLQCSFYAKLNYFLLINNVKKVIGKLNKTIFEYMGVTCAYFLYAQIPGLYVSTLLPKEQAALFFAAYTIANVIMLLSGAQIQKLLPELIKAPIYEARGIIKRNILFILKCAICILIFLIFFGKLLLKLLYGLDYYSNAHIILIIFVLANICCSEGAVYGAYLTASGRQKIKIPMQLETTLITMIGLFIFHHLGVSGVTFAFLLSAIYITTRYIICTRKFLKSDEQSNTKENKHEV